jgi:molecular chaperone GrpE
MKMAKESSGKHGECECAADVAAEKRDSFASKCVDDGEVFTQSAAAMELDGLRRRVKDLEEMLMRARADHDNYRKRMERERSEMAEFACASLLEDLLPVIDNFELGMKAARDGGEGHVVSGFSMILEQLNQLLAKRGVTAVANVGEPFNPETEEAVAFIANGDVPRDHVIQVIRRGYRIGDRLLRPATVVVSSGEGDGQAN